MGIRISTEFDTFAYNLPMEDLKKLINLDMEEDDKRVAVSYAICKHLEGVSISFPKKAHRTRYATVLLKNGIKAKVVSATMELTLKTVQKLEKEIKIDE